MVATDRAVRALGGSNLVILLSAICSCATASEQGEHKCLELGFIGTQSCAACDKLLEYVKDEGLAEECQSCCVEGGSTEATIRKYDKGVLEVCKHRLRDFPHVEGFINNEMAGFPGLTVSYKFGAFPRLVLKSGKQKDSIRIDNWKTEHIVEYLRDKLVAA